MPRMRFDMFVAGRSTVFLALQVVSCGAVHMMSNWLDRHFGLAVAAYSFVLLTTLVGLALRFI